MRILKTIEVEEWRKVLKGSCQHDFYHLPEYHALEELRGEGTAVMLVYEEDDYTVALPLLFRSLGELASMSNLEGDLSDATSVYGYAGPVSSHSIVPERVGQGFRSALLQTLWNFGAVAVFSRLHPLMDHAGLLSGLGTIQHVGCTVSIDLTLPAEVQRKQLRQNHRRDIAKLQTGGVTCVEDRDLIYLDSFVDIYRETMQRVGAAGSYYFGVTYFRELTSRLEKDSHLFVALRNGEVICGGIFMECDGIVQYHLGGTRNDALELAPMKLVFDTVRWWAVERGLQQFHLGGGVGSREDSLFHFKAGFSERRHNFMCWRWIVRPDLYDELCGYADRFRLENGLASSASGYFPGYRSPLVPR